MTENRNEIWSHTNDDDTKALLTEWDGALYLTLVSAARDAALTVEIDSETAAALAAALTAGKAA